MYRNARLRLVASMGAALLAACATTGQPPAPATQAIAAPPATQYLIVDTTDGKNFRFAGQEYDSTTLAPALIAASTADGANAIVMRGRNMTIGQLLALIPVGQSRKACFFFQNPDSSIKNFTVQDKDGTPHDQSFCPKAIDVLAIVGSFKGEP